MKHAKRAILILLIVSIIAFMLPMSVSATDQLAYGAATVDTQGLRIRTGPGTSHSIVTHLSEGDILVILEQTNSEWYKVNFHGSIGYVSAPLLRDVLTAENFSAQGRITGDLVKIRSRPNVSTDILGTYRQKTEMTVIGINNGWYKVKHDGHTGYVRSDFMEIISGYKASSGAGSSSASSSSSSSSSAKAKSSPAPSANLPLGQQVVDFALGFLGYDYVRGAQSPSQGFDCSGLVYYVYSEFGYSVKRTASTQYSDSNYALIDRSDIAPGDLLFFSSYGTKTVTHVGIYIGDDEFVHASRPGIGVVISRIDSSYYTKGWVGARRVIT